MRDFSSDNAFGAAPEILAALSACNDGALHSYGDDPYTDRLRARMRDLFAHDCEVFLVPTGTAANAIALAALTPPWGAVLCHPSSHIDNDECGAPLFFSGGAKLMPVDGRDGKIALAALEAAATRPTDVHLVKPTAISITQATESGTLYSVEEVRAIGNIARAHGLRLHMDGARFAGAVAALGCAPAEITWRAGVDILSFGATKNGALGVEAIVSFDSTLNDELAYRRKRGGHLFSKMRFLSAQMLAYLQDDLWLRHAGHANAMCARLASGLRSVPGIDLLNTPQANILFCKMPQATIAAMRAQGFGFYDGRWDAGVVRLVTSFRTEARTVDEFVATARALS